MFRIKIDSKLVLFLTKSENWFYILYKIAIAFLSNLQMQYTVSHMTVCADKHLMMNHL